MDTECDLDCQAKTSVLIRHGSSVLWRFAFEFIWVHC